MVMLTIYGLKCDTEHIFCRVVFITSLYFPHSHFFTLHFTVLLFPNVNAETLAVLHFSQVRKLELWSYDYGIES